MKRQKEEENIDTSIQDECIRCAVDQATCPSDCRQQTKGLTELHSRVNLYKEQPHVTESSASSLPTRELFPSDDCVNY